MAKLEKSTTEVYKFYFQSDDEVIIKKGKPYPRIYLSGGWAFFTIDNDDGTLHIHCDWGEYTYRGFPGKTETFKELLCRLSRDYLLRKISNETETNWGKTKRNANRAIVCSKYLDKEEKSAALSAIKEFEPGYHGKEESFCNMFYSYMYEWDDFNVLVREYPLKAMIAVELFFNYLVPELSKEVLSENKG